MTRLIIILSLLCFSLSASAHQPDLSSTILAEKENGLWVLQIRGALTAFEYEVEARFGDSAYATPEEFRELVVKHLLKEVLVRFNGGIVTKLEDGVVHLGHETTATFKLNGVPDEVTSLVLRNAGFSNISHNQSALFVVKEGFSKEQFLLKESNAHMVDLQVSGNKFVLAPTEGESTALLPFLLLGAIGLVLLLGYLAYAKKYINSPLAFTQNQLP